VLPALLAVTAFAGITYGWGMANRTLELYYEAAVRSMGSSWHDFIFGAFDPAGTITVDKLPGALWIQALSVRIFGFHGWAIVLPQVVEGVLTVLVLYRVVERTAGPIAGIVASAVLAISPVTVALNRGNISDSLLILLLVLAADATVTALARASTWWLLLAGFWVGLAFQAKMLEAWLVLPALALVWLVAAPVRLRRRLLQFAAATLVAVTVSLSWMTVVSFVPETNRPYVDGSTNDSLFQQVFEYNGFTRVGHDRAVASEGSTVAGLASIQDFRLPNGPGPTRLFAGAGGRDTGWLIPGALVVAGGVLLERRRRRRGDLLRAGCLLWGSWLVTDLVAFSAISGINAYYAAALTPAIAALCGIGFEVLSRSGQRDRAVVYTVLGLVLVAVGYDAWLAGPAPSVLRLSLLVFALACAGMASWLLVSRRRSGGGEVARQTGQRRAVAWAAALVALAVFPSAASIDIVVAGLGPFDTPWQPHSITEITQVEPLQALASVEPGLPLLLRANSADRYVAATETSILAAPLIIDTGREFEPIGGFGGATPEPSLAQLQRQIDNGELQTIISPLVGDPRIVWVADHCINVPAGASSGSRVPGINIYFCRPP
jgi:4-amino-4-deoxy-L-arabinose transferase-like glycosyltransferase